MPLQAPQPRVRGQDETKGPLGPIPLQGQPKVALAPSQGGLQFEAQGLLRHQLIHQPSLLLDQPGNSPLKNLRLSQTQFRSPVATPHQHRKGTPQGIEGQAPTLPFPNLHGAISRAAGPVDPARR